jgi:hypothetical protein
MIVFVAADALFLVAWLIAVRFADLYSTRLKTNLASLQLAILSSSRKSIQFNARVGFSAFKIGFLSLFSCIEEFMTYGKPELFILLRVVSSHFRFVIPFNTLIRRYQFTAMGPCIILLSGELLLRM